MTKAADQVQEDAFARLRRKTEAERNRHVDARPPNLELKPIGSYAEDSPEQHRRNGEPRAVEK